LKPSLVDTLQCARCGSRPLRVYSQEETELELRTGELICQRCQLVMEIEDGIPDMLWMSHAEVMKEKDAYDNKEVIVTEEGKKLKLTPETLQKYKDLFLNFPKPAESAKFLLGGCYEGHVESANRTFRFIDAMELKPGMRVLDLGAHFGWASRRMAQKGCEVVALDICNSLRVCDLFFEADHTYFERIIGDMHRLPFSNESFDVVLANAVLHHSQKGIECVYYEIQRVLKPGGVLYNINECAYGLSEDKSGDRFAHQRAAGIHESAYTVKEYQLGARRGGFPNPKIHFSSFIEDYIEKKTNRKSPQTFKLKLAKWVVNIPPLHRLIQALSVPWRTVFRPKNWSLLCEKPTQGELTQK